MNGWLLTLLLLPLIVVVAVVAVGAVVALVADVAVFLLLLLPVSRVPLKYNLRNLTVRWKTVALTALAFTLVVGLLTVMLAFVAGMTRLTEGSGQPGNVIILSDGATDEMFSNLGFDDSGDVMREPGILRDDKDRPLCSRELYVVVSQRVPVSPGSKETHGRFVQLRGIEEPEIACRVHNLPLLPGGSYFSQAGVQDLPKKDGQASPEQAIQAVVGEGVARELGHDQRKERLEVGDVFELGDRKWVVVGLMKSSGSTFNSEIWAKSQKVGDMFGKQNVFTSMVIRTASADRAREVSANLKAYKKAALQAQPETEYYAKLSETNKQFLVAIYFVAGVMAVGGVFGVMNTMFAAISQRKGDIGVLRILGYARWQILASILVETLVIALLGGLLGLVAGYVLADGRTATSIVSSGQGGGKSIVLKLVVDVKTFGMGLLFTLIMGGLGGLLPAWSAMRLRPLESIR